MQIKIGKFIIHITVEDGTPEARVLKIIKNELGAHPEKIPAIKILRRTEVSKILIDAGLVPFEQIGIQDDRMFCGLAFSKHWVEAHIDFSK